MLDPSVILIKRKSVYFVRLFDIERLLFLLGWCKHQLPGSYAHFCLVVIKLKVNSVLFSVHSSKTILHCSQNRWLLVYLFIGIYILELLAARKFGQIIKKGTRYLKNLVSLCSQTFGSFQKTSVVYVATLRSPRSISCSK